jgi:hypothetical protein
MQMVACGSLGEIPTLCRNGNVDPSNESGLHATKRSFVCITNGGGVSRAGVWRIGHQNELRSQQRIFVYMHKQILTFISTLALAIFIIVIFPRTNVPKQPIQVATVTAATSASGETTRVAVVVPPPSATTNPSPALAAAAPTAATAATSVALAVDARSPVTPPASTPSGTFTVGSSTYPLFFTDGSTLYEAMRALSASNTLFSFGGHDYGSMGFFIDSLNTIPNANGKYWILYINGTLAPRGVSQTILHTNDHIEWRYENSY